MPHHFGKVFRQLREKRDLSIKAAAGEVVSAQFLGRFERGESSISLENFSRLLITIGLDWVDFAQIHHQDRLYQGRIAMEKLAISPIEVQQQAKKVSSDMENIRQDNPFQYDLEQKLFYLKARGQVENFKTYEKEIRHFINEIESREYLSLLNHIETDFYLCIIEACPYQFVKRMTKHFLEVYSKQSTLEQVKSAQRILIATVGYFSKRGYYLRADLLIKKIRSKPYLFKYQQTYEMICLEMEETYHLLRQNKVEGLSKARVIIEWLTLSQQFEPHYREELALFHQKVQELNYTGKELYG
ncbi:MULTISPECIES: helix-turn-helix transcriptional regulator [unclassified Streptococcus]|uniref:helix-turn-helix domain-containing protein n=1 Tax=unclassified Streptococcus TaxID=2608887 RepID=UPI001648163E|nr:MULTISPECIES: helix-turn-helix transcriptional regulator [unclassified Streptococcus]